jgi:hypothetical protein
VVAAPGASGAVTHEYLSSISEVPAGPPLPGAFGNVRSLTVDGGELFVADADDGGANRESRIDRFSAASGAFLGQFPQEQAFASLLDGIAVGHATGETQVYVGGDEAGTRNSMVAVFGASGALLGDWRGLDAPSGGFGCFGCASSEGSGEGVVAVDGSGSLSDWAAGDVYVEDHEHKVVDVFRPLKGGKEEYVTSIEGVEPGVPFERPENVAVDSSNGDVLVRDERVVDVFEPVAGMSKVYRFLFKIAQGPEGEFTEVHGLAVDSGNGDIYVSTQENGGLVVDEFGVNGGFLGQLTGTPTGPFGNVGADGALSVDPETHHVFVGTAPTERHGVVDVFGEDLVIPDVTTGAASAVQPTTVTLNGSVNPGGVQVSECLFEYGPSEALGQSEACTQTPAEIGAGSTPVAVSAQLKGLSAGAVYHYRLVAGNAHGPNRGKTRVFGQPQVEGVAAVKVEQTTVELQAQVDPEGVDSTYRFEYGTTSAYGTSIPVALADIGAGEANVPVSAELTGLRAGMTYHYRLVAVNAAGTTASEDATFTTVAPALIEDVTVTNVAASSATVNAQINPLGSDTVYHIEYGASTAYGASVPVPSVGIGAGSDAVAVSQTLTGLTAATTYHVRVAAQNALGTAYGSDHTFVYAMGGEGLPDGRAYEMVTPPRKNGALIGDVLFGLHPEVSENGRRVVDSSVQCFGGSVSCVAKNTELIGSPYEFSRSGDGWMATPLAPSAGLFPAMSPWGFGGEAGSLLFSAPTSPGGEDDFYVREPDGSIVHLGPVTAPSSGALGPEGPQASYGFTPDLSHVVWMEAQPDIWPFDPSKFIGLYEYGGADGAQPELVGVSGGPGSASLISECGTTLGVENGFTPGRLSVDGRVVFFTADECASGSGTNAGVPVPANTVYARIEGSRTVLISGRSSGECSGACMASSPSAASFAGASQDGSKAFFESTQQLTDEASEDSDSSDSAYNNGCAETAGVNGCNLYEYDFANPAGRELVDVSAGDSSGGGPRVQGVMALSPDGSHVYFIAKGVLTRAGNSQGQVAQNGANNLYVFERDASYPAGRVAFIASLPPFDYYEWAGTGKLANVTPDGRFLVFVSSGRLTADDTSVSGARQVFRYDAQTGELVRISIGNDGFDDNGNRSVPSACGLTDCSEDATIVPPSDRRFDPTMSNDGSFVFFRSPLGLTPGALNDALIGTESSGEGLPEYAENVYEWHEGHVYLISDGRDLNHNPGPSGPVCMGSLSSSANFSSVCLLGTDATGTNVFFTTADQLVPQDTDTQVDVYDARVCTAGEPCPVAPAPAVGCTGEGCHGTPPVAPGVPNGATASFNGPGNPVSVSPGVAPGGSKAKAKKKKRKQKTKRGRRRIRRRAAHGRAKGGSAGPVGHRGRGGRRS